MLRYVDDSRGKARSIIRRIVGMQQVMMPTLISIVDQRLTFKLFHVGLSVSPNVIRLCNLTTDMTVTNVPVQNMIATSRRLKSAYLIQGRDA